MHTDGVFRHPRCAGEARLHTDGRKTEPGEQNALICSPTAGKSSLREQEAPICTPKGSSDGRGEQNALFHSPENLSSFLASGVAHIGLFLFRPGQKDFRNQLFTTIYETSFNAMGRRRRERNNSGANCRKRDVGRPVQGAVAEGKGLSHRPWP